METQKPKTSLQNTWDPRAPGWGWENHKFQVLDFLELQETQIQNKVTTYATIHV